MDPSGLFEGRTMTVPAAIYVVVKTERGGPNAFATTRDEIETTVAVEEEHVDEVMVVEIEWGWEQFTFEMALSFELVDFLMRATGAPTVEDISVFALSAYSTGHVLVQEDDVVAAATKLEPLGSVVERAEDSNGGN